MSRTQSTSRPEDAIRLFSPDGARAFVSGVTPAEVITGIVALGSSDITRVSAPSNVSCWFYE